LVGYALDAAGQVRSPLFVEIVLAATALGLVAPILKDEGLSEGEFGQLVLAAATIADFGTVILLSLVLATWIIRSENKGFCEDLTRSRR